jgi:EmrB/QacA subfamily drug resistance transporter
LAIEAPAGAVGEAAFCPPHLRKFVLAGAILASSMGFIDGSVVAIAMPSIRSALGASLAEAQWVSNAYMLFLSALILPGGAVGDRYGMRNAFLVSIGAFIAASIACALAPSVDFLIAARALKGVAAAVMVPSSMAIIARAYPPAERAGAIGIWAAAAAATTTAGPLLGGAMLTLAGEAGWRLVFAINLPIGIAALALLMRVPPDSPSRARPADFVGAFLATAGLGLICLGLTGGTGASGDGVAAGPDLRFAAAGGLLFAAFVYQQARNPFAMMPLSIYRSAQFSAANLVTFLLYFPLYGVFFFLPMTLVAGWGMEQAAAAAMFLPIGLLVGVMSGPVGALARRTGPWPLMCAGSLLCAAGYGGMALLLEPDSFWSVVMPMLCIAGIGMGLLVAPLSAVIVTSVAETRAGIASAVNNAVARTCGLLAVAALGSPAAMLYRAALAADGRGLAVGTGGVPAYGVAPGPDAGEALRMAVAMASSEAFTAIAWLACIMCLAAGAASAAIWRWRGAEAAPG